MGKQWDKIFKRYGKVFTKPQEDIPKIVKLFKKKGVKRVLDLGCGSGRHVVYLAKHSFDVYGIDIAPEGIKIAKDWLKEENLKANLKVGDIYKKLPYQNNFFDAIISIQTLHHARIEKIRRLIKEMERILRPGGLIFVTVRRALRVKGWKKNKIVIHRWKWKRKKVKYKVIGPRIYVPVEGGEKGLLHFCFNKELIKKEFESFKISKIWIKYGHYCFLGEHKTNTRSWLKGTKKFTSQETIIGTELKKR
jgi:SAM-dependent methyltransferase